MKETFSIPKSDSECEKEAMCGRRLWRSLAKSGAREKLFYTNESQIEL